MGTPDFSHPIGHHTPQHFPAGMLPPIIPHALCEQGTAKFESGAKQDETKYMPLGVFLNLEHTVFIHTACT